MVFFKYKYFHAENNNNNKPYSFGNDAWSYCSHFDYTCKSLIINSNLLRMVEYIINKTYVFNEVNQLKLSTTQSHFKSLLMCY